MHGCICKRGRHRQTTSQREVDRHMYACMYAHSMIDMLVYANKQQQQQTNKKEDREHTLMTNKDMHADRHT